MIYTAPCKINLGLNVLQRRADGYHDIETVMVAVPGLCDVVEVLARPKGEVTFKASGIAVDCPADDNLVLKAYRAVVERYPSVGGIYIHLRKIVPFGAGLGGGSSDAMSVIRGVSQCYNLDLTAEQMAEAGASIGSDTPFFAYDTPMLCTGRGEIMTPAEGVGDKLKGLCLSIVKPAEGVSTAQAYSGITPRQPHKRITDVLSQPMETWRETLVNDFEESVFRLMPVLRQIKDALYEKGALYAAMSGSGSAMYALSRKPLNLSDMQKSYFVSQMTL